MSARTYRVCDLFCGAGGSSSGAARAIRAMGAEIDLVAINHWDLAIATHSENHPHARHYCVNLDAARPEDIVPDGRLDLLMASPECQHHSRARGGRPVHDQRRMSAWHVQRWAAALDIRCILVENVGEFVSWGPLLPSGRPDPAGKGLYFQAWIQALWAMGYTVDWKLLNAADFGDATTRVRFFLQARKDGRPIRWPEPTHSATGGGDMFGDRPCWRAAREVIDWTQPGRSILDRKRPLSEKTRRRIARGLQRFGGSLAQLYIDLLDLPDDEGDTAAPPTGGAPAPFVSAFRANTSARGMDAPIPTITASCGSGGMSLVEPTAEPFVLGQQSGGAPRGVDDPLPTVCAAGAISVAQPTVVPYYGTGVAAPVDVPLATVTTRARFALCEPMVVPYGPRAEARDVSRPVPTVMTRDRLALATPTVEPFLVPNFGEREGQAPRVHDIGAPLPAVTSHGAGALVAPMIVQAKMTHQAGLGCRRVGDPLYTVVADTRLGLVEPTAEPAPPDIDPRRVVLIDGVPHMLDIRFRMLTNRELARAMSFDDDGEEYRFTGNVSDVTRQIGNAVPCRTAAALVGAILGGGA